MKGLHEISRDIQREDYEGKEFKKRYKRKVVDKISDKDYHKAALMSVATKNLALLHRTQNRAKSMKYFDDLIKSWGVQEIPKGSKKVIGYYCNFIPEELVYAADAIPVRLCSGFFESSGIVEEVLPRDICPLVKSCFGLHLLQMPMVKSCDVVVVPTTCDAKKKLGEILADYTTVWTLELPNSKDKPRGKDLWLSEIMEFKEWVEKITGNKITKGNLKRAIDLLRERTKALRRLIDIRKLDPPVISERDYLIVIQTSFFTHAKDWTDHVNELCYELEENLKNGKGIVSKRTPRILITGSPIMWPNFKVLNLIEESDMVGVIDDLCTGTQHLYDVIEMDETTMKDMMEALAERYLLPSVCPCFTSNDDRLDKLSRLIDEFHIDGVVYHTLRLCQIYDLESGIVEHLMEDKKIPLLKIATDYSEEDKEQLRTRIEAFREMIKV